MRICKWLDRRSSMASRSKQSDENKDTPRDEGNIICTFKYPYGCIRPGRGVGVLYCVVDLLSLLSSVLLFVQYTGFCGMETSIFVFFIPYALISVV
jgi:hypothetical protein